VRKSRRIEALKIPLVIALAEQERLCSNTASAAVAARAPHGRSFEIAGAFHEILMETDDRRAQFWDAFDQVADEAAPR
jgi:lysophospholipase